MSTQGVKLKNLLPSGVQATSWDDVVVNGLAVDSRVIEPGQCFLAYPGHAVDGRRFITDALGKGAAVVLAEADALQADPAWPVVAVKNLKQHLGEIASAFYGNPSAQINLVAVTGTNGKTTVSQLLAHAAQFAGMKAGVIGTLGNGLAGQLEPTSNTTPDVIACNRLLREICDKDANLVVMEASSHGLVQGRMDGLQIRTAIFTNLSRDHLDYHGSMDAYRDAKALLAQHPSLQNLILNADDPAIVSMAALAPENCVVTRFSLQTDAEADIKATQIRFGMQGLQMDVLAHGQRGCINSRLVGEFNGANLLAALAGLLALGVDLAQACAALGRCAPVAGRMEMVNVNSPGTEPAVVVDFAHSPDALEKVLSALRLHCVGKLWCVFGCGGDRDKGKRPLMGHAVAERADHCVITSDNPRSEKPAVIIADIVKGLPSGIAFEIIENRRAAVEYAVLNAQPEDLILLAGKGHEDYQEVQGIKHPYSDVQIARDALIKRQQQKRNG